MLKYIFTAKTQRAQRLIQKQLLNIFLNLPSAT